MNRLSFLVPVLLATAVAAADDPAKPRPVAEPAATPAPKEAPKKEEGAKLLDGMSILGNRETPKALVIVPWKSSELGSTLGLSPMFDDSRAPVDRDVFMRALSYYEIRSESARHGGAPVATAVHRSKS